MTCRQNVLFGITVYANDTTNDYIYKYSGVTHSNGYNVTCTLTVTQINELLYFSEFILGLNNMTKEALLRLTPNIPSGAAYVEITAIDSWGATSNSVICPLKLK